MKHSIFLLFLATFLIFTSSAEAQRRRAPTPNNPSTTQRTITNTAVVADERLAVLRDAPSLFAKPIQRMRMGRIVQISASKEADGVTFYRVTALPNSNGWVQADAVFGKFRRGDDERLAKLVQAFEGFEQIECGMLFLQNFPESPLRPAILLLLGDLIEGIAQRLSADATRRLNRRAMAASGAPMHSFYLNFVSLDRYRKLGIIFSFNPKTKLFHYEGAFWREIIAKFPNSNEAAEAKKRLESLREKLEKTS